MVPVSKRSMGAEVNNKRSHTLLYVLYPNDLQHPDVWLLRSVPSRLFMQMQSSGSRYQLPAHCCAVVAPRNPSVRTRLETFIFLWEARCGRTQVGARCIRTTKTCGTEAQIPRHIELHGVLYTKDSPSWTTSKEVQDVRPPGTRMPPDIMPQYIQHLSCCTPAIPDLEDPTQRTSSVVTR